MDRTEAVERYLNYYKHMKKTVNRLMVWDESKTLRENAMIGKFESFGTARTFCYRYQLKFKKKNNGGTHKQNITLAYKILRDNDFTFDEIAQLFHKSRQAIEQAVRAREK